jgi:hypothetical protein
MRLEIVDDRVDTPDAGRDPRLGVLQEIGSIGRATAAIRVGQRLAWGWAECPEEVTLASPPVVDLLLGSC